MEAYKLFRIRKDGSIGSLFMDAGRRLPIDEWLPAENHARKGRTSHPGWHAVTTPHVPHLKENGRAWYRVELKNAHEYKRPESQGGMWLLAEQIRIIGPVEKE